MSDSKTVFALRKQGQTEDALKLGREVFQKDPKDPWNVRALAWSLHDAIKKAGDAANSQLQKSLIEELLRLPVEEDDEVLSKTCNYWQGRLDSGIENSQSLQRCTNLRREGQLKEAWNLAEELTQKNPKNLRAWNERGWVLFQYLKEELENERPDSDRIAKMFDQYQAQGMHEKPGLLHSMMLNQAVKAYRKEAMDHFGQFFHWWEPLTSYRDEDTQPFIPQGAAPPRDPKIKPQSLVEKAASNLNKLIKEEAQPDREWLQWAEEVFNDLLRRKPDHPWVNLWRANCLVAQNRLEDARALLIPLARQKSSESWAWKGLADTYPVDDEMHLALLSQAAICGKKAPETFSLSIYQQLAETLKVHDRLAESLFFLEKNRAVRTKNDYKTTSIDEQIADRTYAGIEAAAQTDVDHQLAQWAQAAHQVLAEGLPRCTGVFLGKLASKYNKPPSFHVGIVKDGQLQSIPAQKEQGLSESLTPGTPLEITYDDKGGRIHVARIEVLEGEAWQGVEPIFGIVDHVNQPKGLTAIEIGKQSPILLYHDRIPESRTLLPGTSLEIYAAVSGPQQRMHAYHFTETAADHPNWVLRKTGDFSLTAPNPFGFVEVSGEESAFVSPSLVERKNLKDGDFIEFTMIRKWNKAKGRMGWSVIQIH